MNHAWYTGASDFWSRLTPDIQKELSELGTHARFRKQDVLFRAGSDSRDVFVLMSGRVKIYTLSAAGRSVTLWFCLPGEVFGLAEMARLGQRVVYAEACAESEALILPSDKLRARLSSDAGTAMLLVDMLSCRLRQLSEALLNLIADDVNTRVIKLLLRLHARHARPLDGGGFMLDLPLTHQEMADMTGTTRQSVSTALTQLRKRGLLSMRGRRIVLNDIERLANAAQVIPARNCNEVVAGEHAQSMIHPER